MKVLRSDRMNNWHKHEARIEKELARFFQKRGYEVALHRSFDLFDVIATKIKDSSVLELIGIEIKSDKDNMKRLYEQLPNYLYLFDKVFIAIENKEIPKNFPFPIGIIRVNEDIKIEREAKRIKFPPNKFITKSATMNTIKKSNGKKSRANELILYLDEIENVKRKLIYNSLFHDKQLPFAPEEQTLVNFIIKKSYHELKKIDIFKYEFGEIKIGV